MIALIKCNICNEEIGRIEKDQISNEDIALYKNNIICSLGHPQVSMIDENNEEMYADDQV